MSYRKSKTYKPFDPLVKENKNTVSIHFNSVTELIDLYDKHTDVYGVDDDRYFDTKKGPYDRPSWIGVTNKNGADVLKHSLLGDHDLYEKHLKPKIDALSKIDEESLKRYGHHMKKSKRRLKYSDFGNEIDIHKVYSGKLDTAWRTMERIEVDAKVKLVTLYVNVGDNCGVKCEDSLWRAAAAVKLTESLTKAGKAVRIVVGHTAKNSMTDNKKDITTSIVVKDYNMPLAPERLAAMTHLGFFRKFCFFGMMLSGHNMRGGLGHTVKTTEETFRHIHLMEEVDAGHCRYVVLNGGNTKREAEACLNHAYSRLETLSVDDNKAA